MFLSFFVIPWRRRRRRRRRRRHACRKVNSFTDIIMCLK
jgi:hypothetical protein